MPSVKPIIVVLGSGFGGYSFLRTIDTALFNVIAVSPRNHFLFTPLLPSTTVGTIEFRSIIESIRVACPDVTFYQAGARNIFPERNIVLCEEESGGETFELAYDVLILAVGAKSNTFGIPGVNEHALFLKEVSDARAIRQKIIDCFERAARPGVATDERKRLLHFVVVGGGPTGVEFAAEMHDFLDEDLQKSYPRLAGEVAITLLEAGRQILNTFDEELGAYTLKLFQRQKIHVRTGSLVTRVEPEAILLGSGEQIPYGLLVWSTGIGPTEFIENQPFPKDRGKIMTDGFFLVKESSNIYALGDCATIEGNPLPATSQVAQQAGYYLGRMMNRKQIGKPVQPFRYRHYGMLAYVGSGKALADLANFKGKGFATWIFWRSAYLTKLVSLKNKMLVLFDWFKTFVFGRDISRF